MLPFGLMFEQLSPIIETQEDKTVDFSSSIRKGDVYKIIHACPDVPCRMHEFTIDNNGETFSFNNLTLFIPDRRFEGEMDPTSEIYKYTSIKPYLYGYYYEADSDNIKPRNLMYTCTQHDPVNERINEDTCKITLSWNTSLDSAKLGLDVPQYYYIYTVVDGKRVLLDSTTDIQNYSYKVPVQNDPQQITYIITASPIESNITAQSLMKTVLIPGRNYAFFLQTAAYRSRYVMGKELNLYKNTLGLQPTEQSSFENIGTEAYDVVRVASTGESSTIASVKFTKAAEGYDYAVTYNNGTQDLANLFDNVAPVTTGTLKTYTDVLTLIDRFSASTATNSQPNGYTYVLRYSATNASNACEVPVYKTNNDVTLWGVTKTAVDGDSLRIQKANPTCTANFDALNTLGANIQNYTVYRDEQTEAGRAGKAEFTSDGVYHIIGRASDGKINATEPDVAVTEGASGRVAVPDYASSSAASKGYVPVLNTLYNGDANQPNSYGAEIKNADLPSLALTVDNVNRSKSTWMDGNGNERAAFGATLHITPTLPSSIPYVYYYRLWRVEDGTETLLNTQTDKSAESWATSYKNIQSYYPALGEKQVRDVYLANLPAGTKTVTYIARMYSTIDAKPSAAPAQRAAAASDALDYYITEATVQVSYGADVVTGVTDVQAESPVVSTTYVNLMGQQSATPWQGMNLVVTRYADGTTQSQKVVK